MSDLGRWLRALPTLQGTAPHLSYSDLPDEPIEMFEAWLRGAVDAGVPEAHVATLATAGADRMPDARTLVLKDAHPDRGFAVAGPLSSAKGIQLAQVPMAALNFWWQPLVRAVRVQGTVARASGAEVEADLAARPAASQTARGDWMRWWIRPQRVEFWQGSEDRNHHRVIYRRVENAWECSGKGAAPDGQDEKGKNG